MCRSWYRNKQCPRITEVNNANGNIQNRTHLNQRFASLSVRMASVQEGACADSNMLRRQQRTRMMINNSIRMQTSKAMARQQNNHQQQHQHQHPIHRNVGRRSERDIALKKVKRRKGRMDNNGVNGRWETMRMLRMRSSHNLVCRHPHVRTVQPRSNAQEHQLLLLIPHLHLPLASRLHYKQPFYSKDLLDTPHPGMQCRMMTMRLHWMR